MHKNKLDIEDEQNDSDEKKANMRIKEHKILITANVVALITILSCYIKIICDRSASELLCGFIFLTTGIEICLSGLVKKRMIFECLGLLIIIRSFSYII